MQYHAMQKPEYQISVELCMLATRHKIDISSSTDIRGGKGGNPNAIVEPDNAIDRRMCADRV